MGLEEYKNKIEKRKKKNMNYGKFCGQYVPQVLKKRLNDIETILNLGGKQNE